MAPRAAEHAMRTLAGSAALVAITCVACPRAGPVDRPAAGRHHRASPLLGSGVDRDTVPAETNVLKGDDLTRGGTIMPGCRARTERAGRRRQPRFGLGQSVSADPVLSRVRGIGAARNAARARRLRQRRPLQLGLRRHGQFRPAAERGDRPDEPGRLKPGVRPERARRRAERAAQERLHLSGRRDRAFTAVRSARSAATSSTASRAAIPRSMSRRAGCTRTAGATCNPPTSRISMAMSAGAATPAKCISTSCSANSVLNGPGTSPVELLAADPAAQFTGPNAISNRFMQVSLSGNLASQRYGVASRPSPTTTISCSG